MIHFDEKIILTKKVFDEKMFSQNNGPVENNGPGENNCPVENSGQAKF